MSQPGLHIISFDIPWPPDYGGVIDVYYRLEALASMGISIDLHCFEYSREQAPELQRLCRQVHYYKRRPPLMGLLSSEPYIVSSRASSSLYHQLVSNPWPILFEGLHTCYFLAEPELAQRTKIVRTHNVEWVYYSKLAEVERKAWKQWYFDIEARRLKNYESVLHKASAVCTISRADERYYKGAGVANVQYVPAFHGNRKLSMAVGPGEPYALYHGNLSVPENIQAATWLAEMVFGKLAFPLHLAGKNPDTKLYEMAERQSNLVLHPNPSAEEMDKLVANAQLNILPTFQTTGIKLKLINTLFKGRHCLVNPEMVEDTGLAPFCEVARSPEEMQQQVLHLMDREFTGSDVEKRADLMQQFSNQKGAERIAQLLYS